MGVAKGNERSRYIFSDKTRYIVFHDFSQKKHKLHEIKEHELERKKGSRKGGMFNLLIGSQEIGLIENVTRIDDTKRQVECTSYDVKKNGFIFLMTTEDQMVRVQLGLEEEDERETLEPISRTYLEEDLEYIKSSTTDHKTTADILNLFQGRAGVEGGAGGAREGEGGDA